MSCEKVVIIKGKAIITRVFFRLISDFMFSVGLSIHILLCGFSGNVPIRRGITVKIESTMKKNAPKMIQ